MKRVVGSIFKSGKIRQLSFMEGEDILISIIAIKGDMGRPWIILIKGNLQQFNFEFLFYERWNNNKVFDKIIDIIKKEDKAKKAVFSRIFKEKI